MYGLIPEPKVYQYGSGQTAVFKGWNVVYNGLQLSEQDIRDIFVAKLWNYPDIKLNFNAPAPDYVNIRLNQELKASDQVTNQELYKSMGYTLDVVASEVTIGFEHRDGLVNALSTLKQLLQKDADGYSLRLIEVVDWPSIERRSVSNTFAWYAGYGRIGFDMQLWGYDEWVEYLNICSDFKINQFNMCMYGYWPFKFEQYPETELKDYRMKIWNEESKNWVEVEYVHPNISEEFLSRLMEYGRKLGISFFAYIGLNSYNGGYPSIYKERRMKVPAGSKHVNDFDTLCLSIPENIEYLKAAIRRVVQLGFDGIDFEESEEAYWFCTCESCSERFLKGNTPAEAKHKANYWLLRQLYDVIRDENPNCIVGIRAWREPPLEKDLDYLKACRDSIPEDVVLFWAPGLYVSDEEFPKWVDVFGKHRIWARDTEANAVAATMGRLIRIFKSNVLRADEETNHQYIEKDIEMHIDSAKMGVKGINGYMFEWYGYFINLYAHAYYGWGSYRDPEDFYSYSLNAVFGEELGPDILYILKNMLSIHESQLKIFPMEFPFLRNKVGEQDLPTIRRAIEDWPNIDAKIRKVKEALAQDDQLRIYVKHFDKIENAHKRNRIIYDLCIASVNYDNAATPEEKRKYLLEMAYLNERDFDLVKQMFFDVNPVSETGAKSCMYPYHELKRVINNELDPEHRDDEPIYLGVEAFGWLWL